MTDRKSEAVNRTFAAWQEKHAERRSLEERLNVELAVCKATGSATPDALIEEVLAMRRHCEQLLAEATAALKEAEHG